jgi:SAM-dependent MidA family methyltransferase
LASPSGSILTELPRRRVNEPEPGDPRVPGWLVRRLNQAGGSVPFLDYMGWVLHDPTHGAYGSGRLRIGPEGDFATAPSLGEDFAALLAPQVAQWLETLGAGGQLSLVETGPGEGHLALQLALALQKGWPRLAERTELVLVEPNAGMAERQRRLLMGSPLPVRWAGFEALLKAPVQGVVLAHEVLDALAVERIERRGDRWCRQRVVLQDDRLRLEAGEALEASGWAELERLGLLPLEHSRPPGWTTELHPGLAPWLAACGGGLKAGYLLVIDYAHEAHRYYAPQRSRGTLMAYRNQRACAEPLREPGRWDLTAHLCLESLEAAATASGWLGLGLCRQGEALLALGLAQRLYALQQGKPTDLAELLSRRQTLLRLVDPAGLGDFRWVAFHRGLTPTPSIPTPLFLSPPPG